MTDKRLKRQKKPKTFALLDFDDGYSVIETKKIENGEIKVGEKVGVQWPGKGIIFGQIFGLSNSKSNLIDAKTHDRENYGSDEDLPHDDPQSTTQPPEPAGIKRRKESLVEHTTAGDEVANNWLVVNPATEIGENSDSVTFDGTIQASLIRAMKAIKSATGTNSRETEPDDQQSTVPNLADFPESNNNRELIGEIRNLSNVVSSMVPLLHAILNKIRSSSQTADEPESGNINYFKLYQKVHIKIFAFLKSMYSCIITRGQVKKVWGLTKKSRGRSENAFLYCFKAEN